MSETLQRSARGSGFYSQINIVQSKIVERFLARRADVFFSVERVPQLGRNPQLLTRHNALFDGSSDTFANFFLVAIIAGAVKVSVTSLDGRNYGIRADVFRYLPPTRAK